ncbi:helix-turn-helix domain-containing protein [Bacteroides cellulosilyticus]|uniref:Helix-turn-helix domain-containing protein n=1 Tax=Bacteroides cellulosilyticus TaxID=246787 RepID=A0AAW6M4I6_9BACE|nr:MULTISPECIES: helix-turn-helix domain-containing protein [Bacteroides]MCD7942233.1 helix-turn-helix domain-containing protein [Bacteroides intestinalis]MCQ4944133.1 helix-turn-helix domain-containing protein [Bacteroides cellulosilyticus]MCS3056108.1 helix-turn-helix domain-containing protein [Bacteroides cellulosilyticus]MDE8693830.1 helix-turn-helix domain-containing protein [Bacteroides cellulosilyticus]
MEAAKELFLNPQKSITPVGISLGFQYPQYFVRFFKRMTGMTPSEFRGN